MFRDKSDAQVILQSIRGHVDATLDCHELTWKYMHTVTFTLTTDVHPACSNTSCCTLHQMHTPTISMFHA